VEVRVGDQVGGSLADRRWSERVVLAPHELHRLVDAGELVGCQGDLRARRGC
jgi:hypothetical protein